MKEGGEDEDEEQKSRNLQQQSRLLLLSQKPGQSSLPNETIASMKSDEIRIDARHDDLILKLELIWLKMLVVSDSMRCLKG